MNKRHRNYLILKVGFWAVAGALLYFGQLPLLAGLGFVFASIGFIHAVRQDKRIDELESLLVYNGLAEDKDFPEHGESI